MLYVKVIDGEPQGYPITIERIKKDNPNTSFPEVITTELLAELGYEPVPADPVEIMYRPPNTRAYLLKPMKSNGKWKRMYNFRPYSQRELNVQLYRLRQKRDELLKESDWTEFPSVRKNKTFEWCTAWDEYRQALRDITKTTDVFNVRFPTVEMFLPNKPYNSWLLDEQTFIWKAPKPKPNDGKYYSWNEEELSWIEITNE